MPSSCPYCYGTGRNKHGGPCKRCHATTVIPTPIAATVNIGRAIFFLIFLALVIAAVVNH